MMLATGCRIGECLAIGWEEVDLDRATVDVRWRLVRRTGVGLLRLAFTKSGESGERLIPLPSWAVTMLKRRRLAIASDVQAVFPDSLGAWRDPSNVRRVWRQVRDQAEIDGLVSHMLRKTVASFLDDADVSTHKISDQLGHAKVSMTQDRYLGRKLTDRQTADVLEKLMESGDLPGEKGPKGYPMILTVNYLRRFYQEKQCAARDSNPEPADRESPDPLSAAIGSGAGQQPSTWYSIMTGRRLCGAVCSCKRRAKRQIDLGVAVGLTVWSSPASQ